MSDEAEPMMGSLGWNTHSLTLPLWPGSLYMRLRVCEFQMYTQRSPLPAVTCGGERRSGWDGQGGGGRARSAAGARAIAPGAAARHLFTLTLALYLGPPPPPPLQGRTAAGGAPWCAPCCRRGSSRSAAGSSRTCARAPQTPWCSGWRARRAACPTRCGWAGGWIGGREARGEAAGEACSSSTTRPRVTHAKGGRVVAQGASSR